MKKTKRTSNKNISNDEIIKDEVDVKVKKIDIDKELKKYNKKSFNYKKIIIIFILIASVCGLIISSIKIFNWYNFLDENEKVSDNINNYVEERIENNNVTFYIDFNELKNINSDTIAYIDYKQFSINYVVVKGTDNDYYLNHNFNKKYNSAGWIFADFRNKFDGKDKNIILYGHSMRNGSMFGSLNNILKGENYKKEENQIIKFVTEEGTFSYKIFSIYTIEAEDYYITTDFKNNKEFMIFINDMKARSIYNYNVDIKDTDSILTLSTCQGYTGNKRMVVHAVKLNEE